MHPLRWILPALLGLASCATAAQAAGSLKPYRDEAELGAALDRWRLAAQQLARPRVERLASPGQSQDMAGPAGAALAMSAIAAAPAAESARAAPGAADSITNVQTAGVDEGGIVKRAGDHLVILRRGRLFTVRVGGDQLQPVSMLDAYAPGTDPRGAWYDELLVSGDTVVVVGYSYARGGTEIGLFSLAPDGTLTYRATHHLRSHDYFSARNYASRLVGQQLIFYSPTVLHAWGPPWAQMMPAHRRWGGQALPGDFERILPATRVFRTDDEFDPGQPLALHTVTRCDLGGAGLQCQAQAVLGPVGRVFYVSAGSVYVWTQGPRRPGVVAEGREALAQAGAAVFRLPLDGAMPTGLKAVGMPTDQLSFLEDRQGHLNVLLREQAGGEGLGGKPRGAGRTALLRVPLADFGDGSTSAQRHHYRRLPGPQAHGLQNRFVGDWLLWGAGEQAWALRYAQDNSATELSPDHAVERIEAMGAHAVLVGNAGQELAFSAVRLARGSAAIEDVQRLPGLRQGESRSHGFFYRDTGADEGLLGLPVLGAAGGSRRASTDADSRGGAAVVVLRQRSLAFTSLGELVAQSGRAVDDRCKASCVDWYGNARPIFMGDRVLALMGYELVEGQLRGSGGSERIVERRRVDFVPRVKQLLQMRPTPFD